MKPPIFNILLHFFCQCMTLVLALFYTGTEFLLNLYKTHFTVRVAAKPFFLPCRVTTLKFTAGCPFHLLLEGIH